MEKFRTVKKAGHAELMEKKSIFIGDSVHIESEEEAKAFVEQKRKEYRDARHIVFAYIVGGTMRYSDDGEPQGTGGPPVLDVIKKNGLTGVAVTVVRIFGGILLGAGGLTRAYSGAAAAAVAAAECAFFEEYEEYSLEIEYTEYQKLLYEINSAGGKITSSDFGSGVNLTWCAPKKAVGKVLARITAATNGKRKPVLLREYFDEEK